MASAVLDIRQLAPAEWSVLRETRLRALCDAPHAFAAPSYSELDLSDHQWRQRCHAATWVVARERGEIIGIAGLVEGEPPHKERHVEGIWVAPTHRQRGVCRSLIDRLAADEGRDLMLWVLDGNIVAEHAYARIGFVWTGERQLIDPERGRYEKRMRLSAPRRRGVNGGRSPRS